MRIPKMVKSNLLRKASKNVCDAVINNSDITEGVYSW